MDSSGAKNDDCVRVAVNIRPLITTELLLGCTDCISVVPGEPQIQIASHSFTYDCVYGSSNSASSTLYEDCVAPLVDALFHGYNATVLAYGQTGSGKTYTMGTNYNGEANCGGVIPQVMEAVFEKVKIMKENIEFLIRVSFIEIFKEEVFDLLDLNHHHCRTEGGPSARQAMPARVPIQIRETANGGISLAGVSEPEVCSKEEMASFLARGSLSRATGSTNMNSQSSRSHAIFTISIEQRRNTHSSDAEVIKEDVGDDILSAKLHLVDLAGSERAKRTGADGLRLKEGIHINRGLLALGNVISALGDEKKRKEGCHVPYRDSKLTRLLQDSLGGNSKTVMIACVSPADTNAEETINTLKYANRARNIQNKAVINRDPATAQIQKMRSQIEQLQSELLYFRGGGTPFEEIKVLEHRISLLETSNSELRQELSARHLTCSRLEQQALDAQVERDKLVLKLESARNGKSWEDIDNTDNDKVSDILKNYVSKIQELETELLRAQSFSSSARLSFMECLDLDDNEIGSKMTFLPSSNDNIQGGIEEDEKAREHSTLQDQLGKELQELDKELEQKEAEMKHVAKVDTSIMKQHYEKKLLELEHEKKSLQKEIEDLRCNLSNISSCSDDSAKKLKEEYLQKLNFLESQVSELKKKQEAQSQLLRQKQKSDDAAKRLQDEIQRIKSQKVQLQHKIKQESEQFRVWKASREKEVLQLKKEGRRNEYEMHKLLALNQRQKMVLQRKTEEASLATKRLKELLEAKKSSRETYGSMNLNGRGAQALMVAIEHELEVIVRVHEVRTEYERQLDARAAMANEMAKLKDDYEKFRQKKLNDCSNTMSPSARNSRISALENMLATSSSTLVSMASQLSESEERERVFSGKGRWNQVRSLPEAKNLMNLLFNLASTSRCHLRDNELICSEKDSVIRELKEKIVTLNTVVRQLESKIAMLHSQNMKQELAGNFGFRTSSSGDDESRYDLRKAPRKSIFFASRLNNAELLEDMDTSESEHSEDDLDSEAPDSDWVNSRKAMKKRPRTSTRSSRSSLDNESDTKLEIFNEAAADVLESDKTICCTCTKYSSCKTKKCECRAVNGFCGTSCGCMSSKCANRESGTTTKPIDDLSQSEVPEGTASDRTTILATHGAMLLQNALSDISSTPKTEDNSQRRPLSDIGNKAGMPDLPKPSKRKNWRKSVAIKVLAAPSQPPILPDNAGNVSLITRDEVTLKLPRAMNPTHSNSHPLTERNSITDDDPKETSQLNEEKGKENDII